jgi:deoxyadenosine/deoxycytidine kinase
VPVIVWLNGGFGAGKTTLAEELHRRLPDAVVYDPEDVGLMLWWLRSASAGSRTLRCASAMT